MACSSSSRHLRARGIAAAASLLTAFSTLPPMAPALAADQTENETADACKAIANVNFEQAADNPAVVISAEHVTDAKESLKNQYMFGKRSLVQGAYLGEDVKELPPHCRITGYVAPAVKFLLLLPEHDAWNEKVMYGACDAFCGAIDEDMVVMPLIRGYAAIATDGGHINKRPFDGVWGYNNREAEIDFSHRASHVAAQISKAIAKEYYGKAAKYAYLVGFSKGGHAGIKSALTYPNDYDGVLSRAPTVQYQGINALRMPYIVKSNKRADGSTILTADDVRLVHKKVIAYCDPRDGLNDGMIEDPRDCDFDAETLLCAAGQDASECLTEEKVTVVKKFYSLPTNEKGKVVWPYPLDFGSEPNWIGFHVPPAPGAIPNAENIARTYLRYIAFDKDPGPDYDWTTFDTHKEAKKLNALKAMIDADDPDLSGFRDSGGKMIVMHGWGDGAISARSSLDWYESVLEHMGDDVPDFARLYLLPGNTHGASSAGGPTINNALELLESWVEKGEAPEAMTLRREENGETNWTRPVYPHPYVAKYKGSGDIFDAANFEPALP